MNKAYLCEDDAPRENLYGTGTIKGLEAEYIDQYLAAKMKQQTHFEIFNEELWKFLFERYGGQCI